jgi:hypothetical protein
MGLAGQGFGGVALPAKESTNGPDAGFDLRAPLSRRISDWIVQVITG